MPLRRLSEQPHQPVTVIRTPHAERAGGSRLRSNIPPRLLLWNHPEQRPLRPELHVQRIPCTPHRGRVSHQARDHAEAAQDEAQGETASHCGESQLTTM